MFWNTIFIISIVFIYDYDKKEQLMFTLIWVLIYHSW